MAEPVAAESGVARRPAPGRGLFAPDSVAPRRIAFLSGATPTIPDTLTPRPGSRLTDSTTSIVAQRPPVLVPYRLLLSVLAAPSASAVRTARSARLGGDFGLTLEYRLNSRLRVRAGLSSSQKRYDVPNSEYQAPANWQWFPAEYQIEANCRVTEIPLDLRYDVLRGPVYTVFTSLGINSLLMRDERYSYDKEANGQLFTKSAHVVNGSNHLFSALRFSAGVERALGGRWAGQAEPFFQLPLGGIGAGQVRLSSAGVAFSLKYGLWR